MRTMQSQWTFLGSCALLLVTTLIGCGPEAQPVTVTFRSADGQLGEPVEAGGTTTSEPGTGAVAAEGPVSGDPGDIVGSVLFDGAAPQREVLIAAGDTNVRDAAVCAAETIFSEKLQVDGASKGIANVFIYLDKAPKGYQAEQPSDPIVFDQKNCQFLPHAMLARTNQTILVKSQDAVAHNTHTFPSRNKVFNSAIGVNERVGVPLVYDKPEREPVEVKCDFHPWMQAFHLPLDHPFMALTDAEGKFEIKGLPAGTHEFRVWHEKGGLLERGYKVVVKPGMPNEVQLSYGAAKFAQFEGPRPKTITISMARGRAGN